MICLCILTLTTIDYRDPLSEHYGANRESCASVHILPCTSEEGRCDVIDQGPTSWTQKRNTVKNTHISDHTEKL
jgi:hypothetical protein